MGVLRTHRIGALLVGCAALVVTVPASAQVLSPGKLARSHAELEGLANCTACHELGKKVDGQKCLSCHKTLKAAIDAGRGSHTPERLGKKTCMSCHKEHRGVDASLVEWGGDMRRFDHKRTGWTLTGAHAKAKCEQCHTSTLVRDADLRKRLAKTPLETFLGLETGCASCHFDEHRAQLKGTCDACHDTKAFRPAPGFKHDKFWALRGVHAKTECAKCHAAVPAPAVEARTLPPKSPDTMTKYKGVGNRGCVSCHRDVHAGKFGAKCESCHGFDSWRHTKIGQGDLAFHDRARFPLKGKHRLAPCESCHPSKPKGGLVTRGLKFARCADCHLDAHLGQLSSAGGEAPACERCHNEDGFYPPRFGLAEHQKARYPLEGAHLAVPCNRCHKPAPEVLEARVPAAVRNKKEPLRGNELVNLTLLKMPSLDLARCDSCHRDPHGGQFAAAPAKACSTCHSVEAFKPPRFDHQRDSRFSLAGKHAKAACGQCHGPHANDVAVVYRGTPSTCAACHRDEHLGQFGPTVDCSRCHKNSDAFKPATFDHNDPEVSRFPLSGKHADLTCDKCHRTVQRNGKKVSWFVGLPSRCDGCHVNVHATEEGGSR